MDNRRRLTVLIAMLGGAIRVSTPFMFVASARRSPRNPAASISASRARSCSAPWSPTPSPTSPAVALARRAGRRRSRALSSARCTAISASCRKVNDIAVGIAMMLLRHRPRLLLRQALHPAAGAAARRHPARRLDRQSRSCAQALQVNPLFFVGIALAVVHVVGVREHPLGPDRPHDRRQRRVGPRHGRVGRSACASSPPRPAASSPASAARSCRSTIPAAGTRASRSGQGLMAVALVIFARWNPIALHLRGAAVRRAPAPSARRCSRSASPQGYYLFNAAPYILTLVIMIASRRLEGRALAGAPGELSITQIGGSTDERTRRSQQIAATASSSASCSCSCRWS